MGEKIKNTIVEILKSDEVTIYYEELLRQQTADILDSINEANKNREEKEAKRNSKITQSLKEENERLSIQCHRYEQKIKDLEGEKTELTQSKSELKRDLETKIEAKEEQLSELNSAVIQQQKENHELSEENRRLNIFAQRYEKYENVEEAFSKYLELSSSTKERLKNIINNNDIYALIHAGFEWNNIEGLWNFCKRRIVENETEDSLRLIKVFLFMFEVFNSQTGKFELIEPNIGERFDSDRHSILGTKTDGNVLSVQLPGIKDLSTGKVIFKAVIEV